MKQLDRTDGEVKRIALALVRMELERREAILFDFLASGAFPRDLAVQESAPDFSKWRVV